MKTDLTTLTLKELQAIAAATGYGSDDWVAAKFHNIMSGSCGVTLVYIITYMSDESVEEPSFVFVNINNSGQLALEF